VGSITGWLIPYFLYTLTTGTTITAGSSHGAT